MVVNIGVKLNSSRAAVIAISLKPLKDVLVNLKYRDPQYLAVRRLASAFDFNVASLLVVLNGIISYQLGIPGEKYWLEFADFFSKASDVNAELFKSFLVEARCTRLLSQKLERVKRVLSSDLAVRLLEDGLLYCSNLRVLVSELARLLRSKTTSKTILFATKMYGYLCDLAGAEPNYADIPIPVDYRNAILSLTSCIVEDCRGKDSIEECAVVLTTTKYAKYVQEAWSTVCSHLNTPCLLLDVFTWLFVGKAIEANFKPREAAKLFKRDYGIDVPVETAEQLLECAERYVRSTQTRNPS
ncbi:MAG: N-glycosylase/DNA lyase [Desulfurococcaceae archaeon]